MKKITYLLLCTICLFACENTAPDAVTQDKKNGTQTSTENPKKIVIDKDSTKLVITDDIKKAATADNDEISSQIVTEKLPEKHNCKIQGNFLKENELWVREKQLLFRIAATGKTKDEKFGDSHRALQMYSTRNCKQVFEQALSINRSPDFPYYLAKDIYRKGDDFVVIQGFGKIYIHNINDKNVPLPLEPKFKGNTELVDAQSGMIKGLMRSGNCLLGMAQDMGTFAFNLKTKKAVLPAAKYKQNELYFLPDEQGNFQAVMPRINEDGLIHELKKLFANPEKFNPVLASNIANNRFIILNADLGSTSPRHLAIDMKTGTEIKLPKEITTQKIGKILNWIKSNI